MPQVRTIFISDVHLGTRICQAGRLLDFLRAYSAEQLVLVGDIVDLLAMRRGIHWSTEQNTVIRKILRRGRHGARIVLIPGNHDQALRDFAGATFGDIRIVGEWEHVAADGRRYLVVHGDAFDPATRCGRSLALLGDVGYTLVLQLNAWLAWGRRRLGISRYWSLAGYAKRRIGSAVGFVREFEESVVRSVRQRGVDGVVCGHIHAAAIRECEGFTYINCGDWVDSCTAVVEHHDGRFELVHWHLPAAADDPAGIDDGASAQILPGSACPQE